MQTNYPQYGPQTPDQKVPESWRTLSYLFDHSRPELHGVAPAPLGLWQGAFQDPAKQSAIRGLLQDLIVATAGVYGALDHWGAASTERSMRKTVEALADLAVAPSKLFLHERGEKQYVMKQALLFADAVFSYAGIREGSPGEHDRGIPGYDPILTTLLAEVRWNGEGLTDGHIAAVGNWSTAIELRDVDDSSTVPATAAKRPAAVQSAFNAAKAAAIDVLGTADVARESIAKSTAQLSSLGD